MFRSWRPMQEKGERPAPRESRRRPITSRRLFRRLGLKSAPGADGYFQEFSLPGQPSLGEPRSSPSTAPEGKTLTADTQIRIQSAGHRHQRVVVDVPIVFAGYGITAKDRNLKLDYDDYAGIDVKGKAVLIIRREPQQDNGRQPVRRQEDSANTPTFRHKATNAFQHGAAARLLVNDLAGLGDEQGRVARVRTGGARRALEDPVR